MLQRHPLDTLALVCGLLFVAVAVVGLVDAVRLSSADVRWLGPAALVAVGLALLASSLRGRRPPQGDPDGSTAR